MMLLCHNDDDGIVDDQANGKHKAEERESVNGETERRENDEGADERDRNGEQRNERGAPALKKNEDDEYDQAKRFKKRQQDFLDAGGDGLRGVQQPPVRPAPTKRN